MCSSCFGSLHELVHNRVCGIHAAANARKITRKVREKHEGLEEHTGMETHPRQSIPQNIRWETSP